MRTTVRLPDDLLRRAKQTARNRNTTLTALIEQGLREVLRPGRAAVKFEMPPVSKETGGLQPGIDLTRTSEILELLDADLPLEKRR
jgi:hypothetical protein